MGPKSYRHTGPLELVVYVAGKDPTEVRLPAEGRVTLGRGTHNTVVLEDTSVSREHAVLHIGSGLRIEDKSSCNGTEIYKPGRVSGTDTTIAQHPERGRSFDVNIGDRIKLGSVILVIRKALFELEKGTSGARMWTDTPTISDPSMEALYEDVRVAARTSAPVPILIYGETGAGKESVAREVHDTSSRKSRPFVAVNCRQFAESLVEDALFGHLKGSHSEAKTDKKGFFDVAHTGTLFLDEIADLPLDVQVKLLRVLDRGEIYPIGATEPRFVDVRVVAATNKNLFECVQKGTFREDLYYRLKGFEFDVPPLRKRPQDILPLAERFLADACRRDNQPNALRFSEAALACLRAYAFPGNVRELKLAVEVANVRCRGPLILPEHFPPEICKMSTLPPKPENTPPPLTPPESIPVPPGPSKIAPHGRSLAGIVKEDILLALHKNGGNQKAAARDLGISNRTLVNWLNHYRDIPRPKKKNSESPPPIPPTLPNSPHGHHPSNGNDDYIYVTELSASHSPHSHHPANGWPHGDF